VVVYLSRCNNRFNVPNTAVARSRSLYCFPCFGNTVVESSLARAGVLVITGLRLMCRVFSVMCAHGLRTLPLHKNNIRQSAEREHRQDPRNSQRIGLRYRVAIATCKPLPSAISWHAMDSAVYVSPQHLASRRLRLSLRQPTSIIDRLSARISLVFYKFLALI
jgi:hypothetical protein